MLCFRCGSPVDDQTDRCANCGQELRGSSPAVSASFSDLQKKLRPNGRERASAGAYQVGDVVLERYEIQDIIGEGGLGTVYKALDQEVEVEVALKVIAPEVLPNEEARLHCLRALQPLRDLVHENVVRTFDVDRDGERCFCVMQLLEGLTLRKIMKLRREKGQRFTVGEAEPIFSQLCRALGESRRRMAHGGLKPENAVILPDQLKITDFALASAIPRAAYLAAQRSAGEAYTYLAPELRAGRAFDSRADVYSVAVIVVELLTGVSFRVRGSDGNLEEVPKAFARVLKVALNDDPARRFEHPGELGEELAAALSGKPLRATQARESQASGAESGPAAGDRKGGKSEGAAARSGGEVEVEEASVPNARLREGSGLTNQLDLGDIEFASQKAKLGQAPRAESEAEDELLLSPPSGGADRTEKVLSPLLGGAEHEAAGQGEPDSDRPLGVESGVIEGTQQISVDMLVPHDEDGEAEDGDTARVRRLSDGRIEPAPPAGAAALKARPNREARAREALQAFDFEATLQDKIESAAKNTSESPGGEEPSAPASASRVAPAAAPQQPAQLALPIAPEVLGRDAVPSPLEPPLDITQSVARPPARKSRALPVAVISFVAVLVLATGGVIYWIAHSRQEAAEQELERKRALAQQLLTKQAEPKPAPVAATVPSNPATAPAAATAAGEPDKPTQAPEPAAPDSPEPAAARVRPSAAELPAPKPPRPAKAEPKLAKVEPKLAKAEPKLAKAEPKPPKGEPKPPKGEPKAGKAEPQGAKAEPSEPEGEKKCPKGMRHLGAGDEGYCIDRYEYPGRGKVPSRGLSLVAAQASCRARGQRLCTAREWMRSCGSLFPYGKTFDPTVCNTGQGTVLPSGAKKGCRSRFGIYDLSGNVSEWVAEGVAMGGDAKSEHGHASCPARSSGGPLTGFRCCADPEWD